MVDIQQRTLRTFEHHEVAAFTRLVQQVRNVNHHAGQDVGNRHHVVQYFLVVNCVNFIEVHQLEVVIFHHFFQFFSEGCFIEQIANAQTATSHFVFISRTDTTTGSADRFRATRFLTSVIQRNVIIKDQRTCFRQQQALANRDTTIFQSFHFFHQRGRRQNNTVTDDADDILAKNT